MDYQEQKRLLNFINKIEKLKTVLRHSWLSSGRRESVAEHTWRMGIMAILLHDRLRSRVKIEKVLKMVLVHDLGEVYAPDFYAFRKVPTNKVVLERESIKLLTHSLPKRQAKEFVALWEEYEVARTSEAKFVQALDKLEVMVQHNQSDIKRQLKVELRFNLKHGNKECEYDTFMRNFRNLVRGETLRYYKKNKVNKRLYA